ncbi:hypothetical protein EV102420_07_00005 [Pseudescherichia vulneris NBRC 102420]|uniref:Uncharacterized protein n=1 Tax=Pseudescherichia vulneris NBRC 102420 TaxID=1115515 RepID=A0A090VQ00_PSEVU|nr:hypothetical protein EV102420_07_00005 [Pseudescherichia vulneris NBRC 102420]
MRAFLLLCLAFWQLFATGSTVFSMEFLMVFSGLEFRCEKVPCDKFRLSYGIFYNSIKNRQLNNFFGFFYYLLINGPVISKSIINLMRQLAANALGIGTGISPSSIVDMAFLILTKVSSGASIWSPMISTIMITVAIIVLVVMSLILIVLLFCSWR